MADRGKEEDETKAGEGWITFFSRNLSRNHRTGPRNRPPESLAGPTEVPLKGIETPMSIGSSGPT